LFLAPGMGRAPLQMIQLSATCTKQQQGTVHLLWHRC
jgi:hypothetical protein